MPLQIAAANWKMNPNAIETQALLKALKQTSLDLKTNQAVVVAVPFPYLLWAKDALSNQKNFFIGAQNCSTHSNGAYTGEVSASILQSIGINYVIVGHSERREYYNETDELVKTKIDILLSNQLKPIFCCGEPLSIREASAQNEFVAKQITAALFHLSPEALLNIVIAYEPIWAIGTGKTATSQQAEDMHAFIRNLLTEKYGNAVAASISILYGGSVKAANAKEIFSQKNVDGGLVGGASLNIEEFAAIINALKP